MSYFTLNEIYFKVNFREYQISLDSPLKATTSYELRMKARKIVESFMFNNSITGPYILYYLFRKF